jgi:hypothetical protein
VSQALRGLVRWQVLKTLHEKPGAHALRIFAICWIGPDLVDSHLHLCEHFQLLVLVAQSIEVMTFVLCAVEVREFELCCAL